MTASQPTRLDRLAGGLVGLLVGDALGVPYEFRQARDIPPAAQIDFVPPPQFDRAHINRGSDESLVHDAHQQSLPTHGHLRSQVCCALYCLWARRVLANASDAWGEAVAALRAIYASMPDALEELDWSVRPDDAPDGNGSGYVVDSLRSAHMVQAGATYDEVVRAAIALGNDTDTTACIAGGIAGLRFGIQGIPERWRTQLRGSALYQPLLDKLSIMARTNVNDV